MSTEPPALTPTEELILDVLGARTRLGHLIWTFGSNGTATRAARSLERQGLIVYMNGVVEKTFRAYLSEEGKALAMDDPNYVPPILGGPR